MRTKWFCVLSLLALTASCSRRESDVEPASRLTEQQRDSVLARSALPGASVTGRAMSASDDAAGRAANLGATLDSLTR